MDRLWSPWRSNYIESFKEKKIENHCVFCSAQEEGIESSSCLITYKQKHCFVMLNLYPYNNGHLMVIPYRHLSNMNELSSDELIEIMDTVRLSMKCLDSIMKPQGFNFGANLGKAAGAGIDEHIHFHVVPRWNGDTNFMPALGEVKIISQDLQRTKEDLIKAFNKL